VKTLSWRDVATTPADLSLWTVEELVIQWRRRFWPARAAVLEVGSSDEAEALRIVAKANHAVNWGLAVRVNPDLDEDSYRLMEA